MTKTETKFCEQTDLEKNEHGVYVYISKNRHSHIDLACILYEYKQWLIENKYLNNRNYY